MEKDLSPSDFIGVQGKGIISFGSGQPDLPPPEQAYSILPQYHSFKYGLVQGQLNLRKQLVKTNLHSSAENFVITNGASEAIDLSLRVLASTMKKKKVLLPRPYYYSYPHMVKAAGLTPVYTDLVEGRMDFSDVEEKLHDCCVMLVNSPSNPTGRVESVSMLKKVEKLAKDLGVYILSDEVYKDLIYTRENYHIEGPRVITVNSFSKTYAMCGFRVGYLWSCDMGFVQRVIDLKSHTSMNTNILGQEMAYHASKAPKSFLSSHLKIWKERRDMIYSGLVDLGLDVWKPEGAFYVLPKINDSDRFVIDMFRKHKVITYMGKWFGAPDRVRFSYALDVEKIEEGLRRVKKYLMSR